MNKRKYLAPVLAFGMTLGIGAQSVSAEKATVEIDKGDTLYSIAEEYAQVSVNDLLEWNPGIEADDLRIGTELTFETTPSDAPSEVFHTVTPGSTLYSIANLHAGVNLWDLYQLNPDIEPRNLQIGQEVRVSRADGYDKEYYTVKPESTLESIANLHEGVTVEKLLDLNPDIAPENLEVGQEIRVQ